MPLIRMAFTVLVATLTLGCGDGTGASGIEARRGYAWGSVTMADGSPLRGDIQDIAIGLSGVTEAGERASSRCAMATRR
jgi:hypothetical protein